MTKEAFCWSCHTILRDRFIVDNLSLISKLSYLSGVRSCPDCNRRVVPVMEETPWFDWLKPFGVTVIAAAEVPIPHITKHITGISLVLLVHKKEDVDSVLMAATMAHQLHEVGRVDAPIKGVYILLHYPKQDGG